MGVHGAPRTLVHMKVYTYKHNTIDTSIYTSDIHNKSIHPGPTTTMEEEEEHPESVNPAQKMPRYPHDMSSEESRPKAMVLHQKTSDPPLLNKLILHSLDHPLGPSRLSGLFI